MSYSSISTPLLLLLVLLFISSLGRLSAFRSDWDNMTSSATSAPHFTECVSRDEATFRCWWSVGGFQNLSQPGALRVFYLKKQSPTSEWRECPEYVYSNRECFFDRNHTLIWITYCVQLRTQDNVTFYDQNDCFTVENIVRPDPPVALNWTLLSTSPYGPHFDVLVSWEPPPSADVHTGWMRLEYELQYRGRNSTQWKTLEVQGSSTQQTIYGLHIEEEYEVHVRCKMKAFTKFGEFSDSVFIQLTEIPLREVRPDPPVALNWTLLSTSHYRPHFDVLVSWEPPPSMDDASTSWMRLDYELQYRGGNSTQWKTLEVQGSSTQQTIYGLHIEEEYEVHVRCKMKAFTKFSEFSDSAFIQLTEIPLRESSFPVSLLLVFGIVATMLLIMLIFFFQQHRLTVFLLPPVPTPKIKGIDPELLKKGKLEELNFILSGGGMGGLPSYAQHIYQDEPWVEFIEVEAEDDADAAEEKVEHHQGSDTLRLLGVPHNSAGRHTHRGFSHSLGLSDDALVRGVRSDPDLPSQEALMLMTLLPGQPEDAKGPVAPEEPVDVPGGPDGPQGPWVNTDFYAQVSDVTPCGGVVLSPGQQLRAQEGTTEEEDEKKERIIERENKGEEEEERSKEPQFQLLVVDSNSDLRSAGSGYTPAPPSSDSLAPVPGGGYHTFPVQPLETRPPPPGSGGFQSGYVHPDSPPCQFLPPVSDYTVVQEVDCQHSLLLNPPPPPSPPALAPQSPPHRLAQHPLKALPAALPLGYITPDLLGNLSP